MNQPADLAEMEMIGEIRNSRCLHKGVIAEDRVIIIGGVEFGDSEIVDKQTMLSQDIGGDNNLVECARKVSYNGFYFKKCSMA